MSSSCLAIVHRCTIMALHRSSRNVLQVLKTSDSNQRMIHAIALPFNIFNQKMQIASSKACVKQTHTSSSLQAGHSKWQNIKHIKAAFDREKSQKSNILAHKIQLVLGNFFYIQFNVSILFSQTAVFHHLSLQNKY